MKAQGPRLLMSHEKMVGNVRKAGDAEGATMLNMRAGRMKAEDVTMLQGARIGEKRASVATTGHDAVMGTWRSRLFVDVETETMIWTDGAKKMTATCAMMTE